ncbi:hypothetical protein Dimus_039709 [Dionaea muscipula]
MFYRIHITGFACGTLPTSFPKKWVHSLTKNIMRNLRIVYGILKPPNNLRLNGNKLWRGQICRTMIGCKICTEFVTDGFLFT